MGAHTLRSLTVCAPLALVAIGATACGSGGGSGTGGVGFSSGTRSANAAATGTASATSPAAQDADGDNDRLGGGRDPDKDQTLSLGPAAGAADRHALTALVKHYYALAAAGDGAGACALLYAPMAESVAEELGSGDGSPALRGKTCAQVASKLFARRHGELARQFASLEVGEMQVKGNRGFVRVRVTGPTEHQVAVHREGGIWKMNVLLDTVGV